MFPWSEMCNTGVGGVVAHPGRHAALQMFMVLIGLSLSLSLSLRGRLRLRLGLRLSLPGSWYHGEAWGLALSQLYCRRSLVELNSRWRRRRGDRLDLKYTKLLCIFLTRFLSLSPFILIVNDLFGVSASILASYLFNWGCNLSLSSLRHLIRAILLAKSQHSHWRSV